MCSDRRIRRYPQLLPANTVTEKLKLLDGRFLPYPHQIMNIVPPLNLLMTLSLNEPQIIETNNHLNDDEPRCEGNELEMLFFASRTYFIRKYRAYSVSK